MDRALIFDLDGTLLDTLGDLCASANYALCQSGFPERTLDEVRRFVGNGVHKLIERAVPQGTPREELEVCFHYFQRHYLVHCQDTTRLYPAVADMLQEVKADGYRTAIVSNKLQAGVDELYETYFRDVVDLAIGERPGLRRKPAPDMVLFALRQLGLPSSRAIYIGDSEVDYQTAQSSGLPCISVLWGFRSYPELVAAGATCFVSNPLELVAKLREDAKVGLI